VDLFHFLNIPYLLLEAEYWCW